MDPQKELGLERLKAIKLAVKLHVQSVQYAYNRFLDNVQSVLQDEEEHFPLPYRYPFQSEASCSI